MSDFLSKLKAGESHQKLADLRQRLSRINLDLLNELQAAQAFRDPHLTDEGLQHRRQQMTEQARRSAAQKLDALRTERAAAAAQIREWADANRPRIADDAVQLQKASLAWDRARQMLDAGRSIPEVIASATDPSMLLAIREWGPDWLQAVFPREEGYRLSDAEPDTAGLVRSADARLAELAGGDVAQAFTMRRDLEVLEAGWEPTERMLTNIIAGGPSDNMAQLSAAYESRFAEQEAAAGLQEPTPANAGAPAGDAA